MINIEQRTNRIDTPKVHPAGGEVRHVAHGDGYVMARRPGCYPFIVTEREWLALDDWSFA